MKITSIAVLSTMIIVALIGCSCASDPCPDDLILDACSQVSSGQGIDQAADYVEGPEPHPIVLLDLSGSKHHWTGKIPENWWPTSVADVELVALVGDQEGDAIQTCAYYGSDLTRWQYTLYVELREGKTAEMVDSITLYGTLPPICGEWKEASLRNKYGDQVSLDQLQEWLEKYVAPSAWAVTQSWPRYVDKQENIRELNEKVCLGWAHRVYSYDALGKTESAAPGKVFIIVEMDVDNLGRESFDVTNNDFRLTDSAGSHYGPAAHWYYSHHFFDEFSFGRVSPATDESGCLLFEVDEGASTAIELAYNFADSWEDAKLAIWQLRAPQGSEHYESAAQ